MTDQLGATPVTSRTAYAGRLLTVQVETVQNPAGQTIELEIVRHPGAAAIVPLLSDIDSPDPEVLLIRQYRYAAGGVIWEIPAGVLEPGEEPEACARRRARSRTQTATAFRTYSSERYSATRSSCYSETARAG